LDGNPIGTVGLTTIARILQDSESRNSSCLTELSLSNCRLSTSAFGCSHDEPQPQLQRKQEPQHTATLPLPNGHVTWSANETAQEKERDKGQGESKLKPKLKSNVQDPSPRKTNKVRRSGRHLTSVASTDEVCTSRDALVALASSLVTPHHRPPALQHLDLSHNGLCFSACLALSETLERGGVALRGVHLAGNACLARIEGPQGYLRVFPESDHRLVSHTIDCTLCHEWVPARFQVHPTFASQGMFNCLIVYLGGFFIENIYSISAPLLSTSEKR
jgi:hypothetical protein